MSKIKNRMVELLKSYAEVTGELSTNFNNWSRPLLEQRDKIEREFISLTATPIDRYIKMKKASKKEQNAEVEIIITAKVKRKHLDELKSDFSHHFRYLTEKKLV